MNAMNVHNQQINNEAGRQLAPKSFRIIAYCNWLDFILSVYNL